MATNIVDPIINDQNLVPRPKARNNPPIASLAAPIQAKNQGEIVNGKPNSATSLGNHEATSNRDKSPPLLQGSPNLSDPNVRVNNNPQIILGMDVKISETICLSACE